MATIILEVRYKHSEKAIFSSFDNFPIRLGRDYSNDLILDDPYISAKHAELYHDNNGNWLLSDSGSENGTELRGKTVTEATAIQAGDSFELGDTKLRIVTADTPIESTRIRHDMAWYLHVLANPFMAWVLCVVFALTGAYLAYLETSKAFEFKEFIMGFSTVLLLTTFWAGCWAFAGRSFKKKASFHLQLSVFAAFSLITIPLDSSSDYLEYMFNSPMLGLVTTYAVNILPGIIILYICLWIATNMKSKRRIISASLISCGIGLLSLIVQSASEQTFNTQGNRSTVLKPPFVITMPASSADNYFKANKKLLDDINIKQDSESE